MGAKLLSPSVVICTVHNIYVPIQIYAYLRAAAPAADPGRIGKPSERIYGTGLHPPQKKWGKDVPGTVLHALLPVMVFMLKGNVRSLVLMFFVMYVVRHFW